MVGWSLTVSKCLYIFLGGDGDFRGTRLELTVCVEEGGECFFFLLDKTSEKRGVELSLWRGGGVPQMYLEE